jgi:hypothetical protein
MENGATARAADVGLKEEPPVKIGTRGALRNDPKRR